MKFLQSILVFVLLLSCTPQPMKIEKAIFSEVNSEQDYEIVIEYPKFSGPGSKVLNEGIQAGIQTQIKKLQSLIADLQPPSLSSLEGNFNVRFNEYPFLSVENRFEMAVPGTSVLLRAYENINFDQSTKARYDSAFSILSEPGTESELTQKIIQAWRAGHEDLPCELTEETPIEDFAFNGKDFLFFINLYSGNPECQWEVVRLGSNKIKDLLKPELQSFLSLDQDKQSN